MNRGVWWATVWWAATPWGCRVGNDRVTNTQVENGKFRLSRGSWNMALLPSLPTNQKTVTYPAALTPNFAIKTTPRTSLVVQCIRISLPMQGTHLWSLVQEDSICHRATNPVCHSSSLSSRVHKLQLLSLCASTTEACVPRAYALQKGKPPQSTHAPQLVSNPPLCTSTVRKDPTQLKKKKAPLPKQSGSLGFFRMSYLSSLLDPAINLSLLQALTLWFVWPHCTLGKWTEFVFGNTPIT